jgi:DNA polymerase-3 subunit beta
LPFQKDLTFVATDAHKLVIVCPYRCFNSSQVFDFYNAKEAFDYFEEYPFCFRCRGKIEYNDSNATFSFDNYILMSFD